MKDGAQALRVERIEPDSAITNVLHVNPVLDLDYCCELSDEENSLLQGHRDGLLKATNLFNEKIQTYLPTQSLFLRRIFCSDKSSMKALELLSAIQQHFLLMFGQPAPGMDIFSPQDLGNRIFNAGVDPMLLMGLHRNLLSHLQGGFIFQSGSALQHQQLLFDLLSKLVFRGLGSVFEGYWVASMDMASREKQAADQLQQRTIGLLTKLPQSLWSIDVKHNKPLFISLGKYNQENFQLAMPIPGLDCMSTEERTKAQLDWAKALQGEVVERETPISMPSGEVRWFKQGFYPHKNTKGRVVRIDGSLEDITERKSSEERISLLVNTDPLTGLFNRTHWKDRLEQAIEELQERERAKLAIILLDLNYFKLINDTHGHSVGDMVLQEVSRRIGAQLPNGSAFARFSGDDFAILLPSIGLGSDRPDYIAKQVLEALQEPIRFQGEKFYVSATMGIAVYPDHGNDVTTLLRRAEIAMYGAKRRKSGYAYGDPDSDRAAAEVLLLTSWIRDALDTGGFELLYQPKVDVKSKTLCGVEALIRLRHPVEGLISPDRFIRHAEQSGLIRAISDWVLNQALSQAKCWKERGMHIPISINLSAQAFQDPVITEKIRSALNRVNLSGDFLEIEITEETLMADLGRGADIVSGLNALGVTVAIDDFGTGYSSLSYLKRLPMHVLKIDRSFLQDMSVDDHDAVLVRSIIELGHNLGYQVIAEGVESKDVWDLLEILGCDTAQGFFIARPLDEKAFMQWIQESDFSLQ